jgi:hypothetical protein
MAKAKRASNKRDTVKAKKATMYAKRTTSGRFKEMDEKGRSLAADTRRKAKRKTKSGFGDLGDRPAPAKRSSRKSATAKRARKR